MGCTDILVGYQVGINKRRNDVTGYWVFLVVVADNYGHMPEQPW